MNEGTLDAGYRAAEARMVFAALRAGDSCCLVGTGSVGKSNLLRLLQQRDTLGAYLGAAAGEYDAVYVDCNKLLGHALWNLAELILHELLMALRIAAVDAATLAALDDLHGRSGAPETRALALRYLERGVDLVCRGLGRKLVLLLDEVDDAWRSLPAPAFRTLRALRDDHKYRLMYVLATRAEPGRLAARSNESEAFLELVTAHTIWLGPYSQADAGAMLDRLALRYGRALDGEARNSLLRATGGHPGLMRAAFRDVLGRAQPLRQGEPSEQGELPGPAGAAPAQQPVPPALPDTEPLGLRRGSQVAAECERIWLSLTPEDQQGLAWLAACRGERSLAPDALERLRQHKLVGGPWAGPDEIFSPLLAAYACSRHSGHIRLDRDQRALWVNEQRITDLPPLEFELLAYLEERRGRVCTRAELGAHLYPGRLSEPAGVEERVEAVVKRLRRRLEAIPGAGSYLSTVRGHGIRLADYLPSDPATGEPGL